jgi:hypothetical protein
MEVSKKSWQGLLWFHWLHAWSKTIGILGSSLCRLEMRNANTYTSIACQLLLGCCASHHHKVAEGISEIISECLTHAWNEMEYRVYTSMFLCLIQDRQLWTCNSCNLSYIGSITFKIVHCYDKEMSTNPMLVLAHYQQDACRVATVLLKWSWSIYSATLSQHLGQLTKEENSAWQSGKAKLISFSLHHLLSLILPFARARLEKRKSEIQGWSRNLMPCCECVRWIMLHRTSFQLSIKRHSLNNISVSWTL